MAQTTACTARWPQCNAATAQIAVKGKGTEASLVLPSTIMLHTQAAARHSTAHSARLLPF